MAAFDQYIVTFGDRNGFTDITSDVMGFTSSIEAGIGQLGKMSATLTINNNDGDYTPSEGGGNGAYKTVDWYTQVLRIRAETLSRDVELFSGVIREIDISDNGVNSTVTIKAVDWTQTVTGAADDITELPTSHAIGQAINNVLRGESGWGAGVTLQSFGDISATNNPVAFTLGVATSNVGRVAQTNVEAFDIITQTLLPAGPFVNYPGQISFQASPKYNIFNYFLIDSTLNKTSFAGNVQFSETPSAATPATTVLPITALTVDFTTDNLTSSTEVTSGISGLTTQTNTNTDAAEKYGSRTRAYRSTANVSNADVADVASFWTNRQSTVRYTPSRISTTISAIEQACGDNAYLALSYLFSLAEIPFSTATITYTPTGGTVVDSHTVIQKRTVRATPSDTTITLDLLPAQDYQSFVLNSKTLGVLGGTLDTYDKATYTYDENVQYDGFPVQGNRLG